MSKAGGFLPLPSSLPGSRNSRRLSLSKHRVRPLPRTREGRQTGQGRGEAARCGCQQKPTLARDFLLCHFLQVLMLWLAHASLSPGATGQARPSAGRDKLPVCRVVLISQFELPGERAALFLNLTGTPIPLPSPLLPRMSLPSTRPDACQRAPLATGFICQPPAAWPDFWVPPSPTLGGPGLNCLCLILNSK